MIGNFKYTEIKAMADELNNCAVSLKELLQNQENEDLNNFVKIVERYSKFLLSTIQMYIDADNALQELTSNK